MTTIRASIIIPTYNGANKIGLLLESLANQTIKEFEVVIVVDGSTDSTLEVINSFKEKFEKLYVVWQENGGRAQARNTGAQKAQSSLLIFIDDDMRLEPNNLEQHLSFHSQHTQALYFANATLAQGEKDESDFHNYRVESERESKKLISGVGLIKIEYTNYCFTTQNLSMRKSTFDQLKSFDNRLRDAEDLDLSLRAMQFGMPIYFDKNLIAHHHDFITLEQQIIRQRQYAMAKEDLLKIHPEYKQILPTFFLWQNATWKDGIKSFVFGTQTFWVKKFEASFFLRLPKKVRYFCYRAFIHTHSIVWVRSKRIA
jgi:glycosyltransferase involved in cell wall biosynthesis